jgi:hypothetical protein
VHFLRLSGDLFFLEILARTVGQEIEQLLLEVLIEALLALVVF